MVNEPQTPLALALTALFYGAVVVGTCYLVAQFVNLLCAWVL